MNFNFESISLCPFLVELFPFVWCVFEPHT